MRLRIGHEAQPDGRLLQGLQALPALLGPLLRRGIVVQVDLHHACDEAGEMGKVPRILS